MEMIFPWLALLCQQKIIDSWVQISCRICSAFVMKKCKTGSQGCKICRIQKDQNHIDRVPVLKVPYLVPGEWKDMGYLHPKAMDVH